jgi:hypothetical protein
MGIHGYPDLKAVRVLAVNMTAKAEMQRHAPVRWFCASLSSVSRLPSPPLSDACAVDCCRPCL